METLAEPVTAKMLFEMPDDDFRYELIEGALIKEPPPGSYHGRTIVNITTPLDVYVRENGLGVVYAAETGFMLASEPDTVRAPDAAFVRRERLEKEGEMLGYRSGAPDLVVEVTSPSDTPTKVEEKVFVWLDAGARMVIVVNPDTKSVSVYRPQRNLTILTEDDVLDGGEVVPGWRLPVKDIFR